MWAPPPPCKQALRPAGQGNLRINKHVSRKVLTMLMPLRVQLILALSSDVKEGRKAVYLKQPRPSPTSFSAP